MAKKLNEVTAVGQLADAEYLLGVDANGKIIKIEKQKAYPVATNTVSGLMSASDKKNFFGTRVQMSSSVASDLNDLTANGIYYVSGYIPANCPDTICQIIVFSVGFNCTQLMIIPGGYIKFRIKWATWSDWILLKQA